MYNVDREIYRVKNERNEAMTKSAATTIVPLKRVFSKPRRVWKPLEKPSPPPKAPPRPASDLWVMINMINTIDSTTCAYGNIEATKLI